LKVNVEKSRIRIRDPDPLVRGMDPRIRIWIHFKISWIRNTGEKLDPDLYLSDADSQPWVQSLQGYFPEPDFGKLTDESKDDLGLCLSKTSGSATLQVRTHQGNPYYIICKREFVPGAAG
jgi:hypothetical protein